MPIGSRKTRAPFTKLREELVLTYRKRAVWELKLQINQDCKFLQTRCRTRRMVARRMQGKAREQTCLATPLIQEAADPMAPMAPGPLTCPPPSIN